MSKKFRGAESKLAKLSTRIGQSDRGGEVENGFSSASLPASEGWQRHLRIRRCRHSRSQNPANGDLKLCADLQELQTNRRALSVGQGRTLQSQSPRGVQQDVTHGREVQ